MHNGTFLLTRVNCAKLSLVRYVRTSIYRNNTIGNIATTESVDSTTTTSNNVHPQNNVPTGAGTNTLGMSALCENECTITNANEKEGNKAFPSPTGATVHQERTMGKNVNTTSINNYKKERASSVQNSLDNANQLLLCLPVSTEEEDPNDGNSIIDIAEDVEFVDNFDFNSTDVDKLEDHVGFD